MGRRNDKYESYHLESVVYKYTQKKNIKHFSGLESFQPTWLKSNFMYFVTVKHNNTNKNFFLGFQLKSMINQPLVLIWS